MIKKLIASDIDGTLIPFGEREIDPKLFQLIEDLRKIGVLFVPASGRTIKNLHLLFEPVKDQLAYLSENGGAVWFFDEQIGEFPIPIETLREIQEAIKNAPDLEGYANSPLNAYIIEETLKNGYVLDRGFIPVPEVVPTVDDTNDSIVKITAMDINGKGVEHYFPEFKDQFGKKIGVAMAGPDVIDFCTTNKGVGLRSLAEHLGLTPNDLFAFGDNYNDLEMLDYVTHSYMVETDDPVRRAAAKYLTKDPIKEIENLYMKLK